MSLILNIENAVTADGTNIYFKDITGTTSSTAYSQSGNITYSQISAIRIKNASYETLSNLTIVNSGVFTRYVEYMNVGTVSITVDGKSIAVGDYFVPQAANIAVTGTWQTTGFYVYPFNWTPTAAQTPLTISPSQLNEVSDTILDSVRLMEYEVYYPQQTPTIANATNGNTYLVTGTGTVTYNGNVYKPNETFTATNTLSITRTGSAVVNVLYATVTQYYTTLYNVYQELYNITISSFNKKCQCGYDMNTKIVLVRTQLEALNNMSATNNVSLTLSNEMLEFLTGEVTQMKDC
jgi:hypothetical protein